MFSIGADINHAGKRSSPAIVKAALPRNVIAIRSLLYNDCDINRQGIYTDSMMFYRRDRGPSLAIDIALNDTPDYDIALMLLQCGAKRTERCNRLLTDDQTQNQRNQNGNRETLTALKCWLSDPPSLKFYCRKVFRQFYGIKVAPLLDSIEYPQLLKDYMRTKIL